MLVYLTLPESGDETYAFTDKILDIAQKYYPGQKIYLAGDSTNEYDFEKSFAIDNKVVSIVSILVVMVVLLFTFKSAGMPVLLILVIQGCIWINFSVPAVTGKYLFYLSYLIVSSIQMGANIDYAIVIASRYQELKAKMAQRSAIVETLNFAFPTIITSGAIMSICGFLIGSMTSEPVIAGIGESLGRGTVDLHHHGHVRPAPDPADRQPRHRQDFLLRAIRGGQEEQPRPHDGERYGVRPHQRHGPRHDPRHGGGRRRPDHALRSGGRGGIRR